MKASPSLAGGRTLRGQPVGQRAGKKSPPGGWGRGKRQVPAIGAVRPHSLAHDGPGGRRCRAQDTRQGHAVSARPPGCSRLTLGPSTRCTLIKDSALTCSDKAGGGEGLHGALLKNVCPHFSHMVMARIFCELAIASGSAAPRLLSVRPGVAIMSPISQMGEGRHCAPVAGTMPGLQPAALDPPRNLTSLTACQWAPALH